MKPEQAIVVVWELLAGPRSEDREVVMAYRPTWKTPPSATRIRWLTISAQYQRITNLPQDCPA
jgi:hypothetical protein